VPRQRVDVAVHHEVGSGQKSLTSPIGIGSKRCILEQSDAIPIAHDHTESVGPGQLPRVDHEVRAIRSTPGPQVVPDGPSLMSIGIFGQRVQLPIPIPPEE
jgi:hypothetical protein